MRTAHGAYCVLSEGRVIVMGEGRLRITSSQRRMSSDAALSDAKILVSGIPSETATDYICIPLSPFGEIHCVKLPANAEGYLQGYEIVTFATPDAAGRAVAEGRAFSIGDALIRLARSVWRNR